MLNRDFFFENFFLRFPVKRVSSPKKETQEKSVKKPVKGKSPSQISRGRQKVKQKQDEEKEEEDEDKEEEELSHSLKKRDKNIQENKAMVLNPSCPFIF